MFTPRTRVRVWVSPLLLINRNLLLPPILLPTLPTTTSNYQTTINSLLAQLHLYLIRAYTNDLQVLPTHTIVSGRDVDSRGLERYDFGLATDQQRTA